MKVLLLNRVISNTGVDKHQLDLGIALKKKGIKVYIMTGGADSSPGAEILLDKFEKEGIKVIKVPFPKEENYLIQVIKYLICIPICLKEIRKVFPDIIHIHRTMTSYIGKISKFIYKIPFIITYHRARLPKIYPFVCKADGAIAISNELYIEILNRYKYEEKQVIKIHNGISKKEFNLLGEKQENKIKKILYVGTLNKRKGIDILLEALWKVEEKYQLLLVGSGDEKWVKELINKFNLNTKVELLGYQNPKRFYSVADIFILPSREEGFPLCVLEAMFMKCAIIRSNVEGAEEQINKENGFLFENENIEELREKIKILLKDNELLKRFKEKAFDYATKNFTSEIMAEKTIKFYNKIIEKGN